MGNSSLIVMSSFRAGAARSVDTGSVKEVERGAGSFRLSIREARLAWKAEAASAIEDLRGGEGGLKTGAAIGFGAAETHNQYTNRVNTGHNECLLVVDFDWDVAWCATCCNLRFSTHDISGSLIVSVKEAYWGKD